jgi:hypothetical protein
MLTEGRGCEQAILLQRMADPSHESPVNRLSAEFLKVCLTLWVILTELQPNGMWYYLV